MNRKHAVTINGETKTIVEWSALSRVSYHTIYGRLQQGHPPEIAVWAPKVPRGGNKKRLKVPPPRPMVPAFQPVGFRPVLGGFRSYSIDMLPILRKM